MNNKSIIKIVAALLFAYILSYTYIRFNTKMITHRTGTSGCNYANHWVEARPVFNFEFYQLFAIISAPLRFLEVQYWNLIQAPGSTLWEEDRNVYGSCRDI